jgi:hypothetical protein
MKSLLWILFALGLMAVGYIIFTWVRDEINKPKDDNDEIMDE